MLRPTHGSAARGDGGGIRAAQLASLIQRIVQMEIQGGIADPRVRGMATILSVDVSGDCEDAVVNVSVLPAEFGPLTIQALNHASAHLRRAVLKQSRIRQSPRLRFALDLSLKRAAAMDAAIRDASGSEEHLDEIQGSETPIDAPQSQQFPMQPPPADGRRHPKSTP